jgi:hypothetical protein
MNAECGMKKKKERTRKDERGMRNEEEGKTDAE